MKIIQRKKNQYILRFVRGERYPEAFVKFLEARKIAGGFFIGLGACINPEVSFYDLKKKKYSSRKFEGDFEVLNLTGNVAKKGRETLVHQHIALAGKDYGALGGHLNAMTIGGTLEVFLTVAPALARRKDIHTGLNLLDVSESP